MEDINSEDRQKSFGPLPLVNRCVHDIITEKACQQPDAIAVTSWDGELTYRTLDAYTTKLAHHLVELGAGPETIIAFCLEKSLWAVVAALAILKSGGAFVALDASTPIGRVRSILETTRTTIFLTSPLCYDDVKETVINVVILSWDFVDRLERIDNKPCNRVTPQNVAVVLFTSGSTGKPKGIVLEHAAISTMCTSYGKALHLDVSSRVLQFASYNFDVSVVDIVDTLIHGACLCVPSEYNRINNLIAVINDMRITWADLTPSLASTFTPEDVPNLRTLVLAGEEVQQRHLELWVGKVRLINCYGPAESSAFTSYQYLNTSDEPKNIGRTMAHANWWILDPDTGKQVLGPGSIGELVVETSAMARGYLNDPEKTRQAFFYDPELLTGCEAPTKRRVYKTGDLVRLQGDGCLTFVGRKDSQIKINGQRVELGEVEHQLALHAAINNCVVVYPKNGAHKGRLVAVVQLTPEGHPNGGDDPRLPPRDGSLGVAYNSFEMMEYLKKALPKYMIPSVWFATRTIPLTVSKKVDRRSIEASLETQHLELPRQNGGHSQAQESVELSCDELTTAKIIHLIAAVLRDQGAKMTAEADCFDIPLWSLGLDSVQVIALSNHLKRVFNIAVGVETLTSVNTTMRVLAEEIDRRRQSDSDVPFSKNANILREVDALLDGLPLASSSRRNKQDLDENRIETVFLTGSTGFLGSQILRQILLEPAVKTIILHVRATTPEEGFERVVKAARSAGWWEEKHSTKLEIWTGDLANHHLGLALQQWERLVGGTDREHNIHAIIHNGAVVRWNADYQTLKAANVLSTSDLLSAVSESTSGVRFVYISGGQHLTFSDLCEDEIAVRAEKSHGYGQTKAVAELLTRRFSTRLPNENVSVVKPSFIIGTPTEGIANQTDYLWRLVAGAIEIGAYNADEAKDWLFVSDAGQIADIIVEQACKLAAATNEQSQTCTSTSIRDGLYLSDFWHILAEDFGYNLKPVAGQEWYSQMRSNVESRGSDHYLWPLIYMLEEGKGRIGVALSQPQQAPTPETAARLKTAIVMNVRNLRDCGFLSMKAG